MVGHIKGLLAKLGLNPSHYSGYSMHIGGATTVTTASLKDWEIKSLGYYKSNTYQSYIRETMDMKIDLPGGWPMPECPSPSIIATCVQWRTIYSRWFIVDSSSALHLPFNLHKWSPFAPRHVAKANYWPCGRGHSLPFFQWVSSYSLVQPRQPRVSLLASSTMLYALSPFLKELNTFCMTSWLTGWWLTNRALCR